MTGTAAPPIPVRLAARPLVGGLVVPYITLETDVGWTFGRVHHGRWRQVILGRRCQTCGDPLGSRYVLLVRAGDIEHGYTAEPAMHPECARYSALACPMVAGRMTHYRSSPHPGTACPDPGCRCGLVTAGPDQPTLAGTAAEPWSAVWCSVGQYETAIKAETSELVGLAVPTEPARVRPVIPDHLRFVLNLVEIP